MRKYYFKVIYLKDGHLKHVLKQEILKYNFSKNFTILTKYIIIKIVLIIM